MDKEIILKTGEKLDPDKCINRKYETVFIDDRIFTEDTETKIETYNNPKKHGEIIIVKTGTKSKKQTITREKHCYHSTNIKFINTNDTIQLFEHIIKHNKTGIQISFGSTANYLFHEQLMEQYYSSGYDCYLVLYKNIEKFYVIKYNNYSNDGSDKYYIYIVRNDKYMKTQIEKYNICKIKKQEKKQRKKDRKSQALDKLTLEDRKILGLNNE